MAESFVKKTQKREYTKIHKSTDKKLIGKIKGKFYDYFYNKQKLHVEFGTRFVMGEKIANLNLASDLE